MIYLILQRDLYTPAGSRPLFASEDLGAVETRYGELIRNGVEDIYIDEIEILKSAWLF